jgi:hypothetical protein
MMDGKDFIEIETDEKEGVLDSVSEDSNGTLTACS